jgi:hypothetical protein
VATFPRIEDVEVTDVESVLKFVIETAELHRQSYASLSVDFLKKTQKVIHKGHHHERVRLSLRK